MISRTQAAAPASESLSAIDAPGEEPASIPSLIFRAYAAVALFGLLFSPALAPDYRPTAIVNAFLLLATLGIQWAWTHLAPDRRPRITTLPVLVAMMQPVCLILLCFLQGDISYIVETGYRSFHDGATTVAAVTGLFYLVFIAGAAVVSFLVPRRSRAPSWSAMQNALPDSTLAFMQVVATLLNVARVFSIFSFGSKGILYVLRIAIGLLGGSSYYLGIGLRRNQLKAWIGILILAAGSTVLLLAGSRGQALTPVVFVAAGFATAKPLKYRQLLSLGGALCAMFFFVAVVGEVARSDDRGRSGEVALSRIDTIRSSVLESAGTDSVLGGSLCRLLRSGTHSIITMIPAYYPHEEDGLFKLPRDIVESLPPGFHLEGAVGLGWDRNWMLNDLGFSVNEYTAVEFDMLGDAWYRGGLPAIVSIAFFYGAFLQLCEEQIYRGIRKAADYHVVLLLMGAMACSLEAINVAAAVRAIVHLWVACGLLVLFSRLFGSKPLAMLAQPDRRGFIS